MARTIFGRPLRTVGFDLVVSGLVALLAITGTAVQPGGWPATLIGFGMALALLFRRRHPSATAAVVAALALLQVYFDWHPLPYDVAVLIAMYSVVKYAERLRDGIVAGAAVAVGILLTVQNFEGVWWVGVMFLVLMCGAVWLAALNVRTRRLYVLSLEERAVTLEHERDARTRAAVAEERTRIARELHDVVAHSMAVMIVQADGARYMIDRDVDTARGAIKIVADTGREALEEMRRLVGVLREPSADVPGEDGPAGPATPGSAAVEDLGAEPNRRRLAIGELDTLLDRSRRAGLTVRQSVLGAPVALPAGVELTLYRVVQEALTNALKHVGAGASVEVVLDYAEPGTVSVRIVDDGRGRGVVGSVAPSGGHGLVGMRERVAVYGGTLHAGARLAGGWQVDVRLPLPSVRAESQGAA
ncbi:sensor histidine kinase [Micromonospora sonneratiae]|uniref:histidine kinase n=1 Tax=Micromonospora sonneratiae TaxID=1184706 RepID=A0ABW3Y7F3_9ACTN